MVELGELLIGEAASSELLRLVTCGGQFNLKTHHYLNNFIVFAALAGRR